MGADILDVLAFYTQSEQAVYHPDARVTRVLEFYGPISGKNNVTDTYDATPLYRFFEIPAKDYSLEPVITPLLKHQSEDQNNHLTNSSHQSEID